MEKGRGIELDDQTNGGKRSLGHGMMMTLGAKDVHRLKVVGNIKSEESSRVKETILNKAQIIQTATKQDWLPMYKIELIGLTIKKL